MATLPGRHLMFRQVDQLPDGWHRLRIATFWDLAHRATWQYLRRHR